MGCMHWCPLGRLLLRSFWKVREAGLHEVAVGIRCAVLPRTRVLTSGSLKHPKTGGYPLLAYITMRWKLQAMDVDVGPHSSHAIFSVQVRSMQGFEALCCWRRRHVCCAGLSKATAKVQ